jgi:beta-galactosidase
LPHWNWPNKIGQPINVWVYSNLDTVELLLNNKSLGKQTMPPGGHLEWNIPYTPGTLLARGYHGTALAATAFDQTTGPPVRISLVPDRPVLYADGQDAAFVTVSVVDAQNRPIPDADNLITFQTSGSGKLLGLGNGDPSDHDPDNGTTRHLFSGLALAIVQASQSPGSITLTAVADGLPPATLTLRAAPVPSALVVP